LKKTEEPGSKSSEIQKTYRGFKVKKKVQPESKQSAPTTATLTVHDERTVTLRRAPAPETYTPAAAAYRES